MTRFEGSSEKVFFLTEIMKVATIINKVAT